MKIKEYVKNNKVFLSLLFFTFALSLFLILFFTKESDFFWHIKAGKYMVTTHTILTKDVFSWFMNGKYWMSHEWLFEVIIYSLSTIFTKYYILVYGFITLAILNFILLFTNKKNYLKNIPFTAFWMFIGILVICFLQARPHMISFSFLALTIYLCFDLYNNKDSNKIFILPLIALLWSNVHGGSSNLSYLFCIGFMFVGIFKFKLSKIYSDRLSKKQFIKYGIVVLLCIVMITLNPHGLKMLTYPYVNLGDTLMISSISEWQPSVLSDIQHYPYFLLILFVLGIFIFSKKKIALIDFSLFLVCVFLGLKSIRFWFYTYIICTYFIFNYINKRKYDNGTCFAFIVISCMFIVIFCQDTKRLNKIVEEKTLSDKMIATIKENNPKRLYNFYNYGGELIYNDINVFIDGRADLYSKNNFKDYIKISNMNNNYIELIDKYKFDYFLVEKSNKIYQYLKYNDDYQLIYKEKKIYFYKKNTQ